MDNKLCRLYGTTTLDGLKAICGSKQFGEHINMSKITRVHDDIFKFQTYSIAYTEVALKLINKLKEFSCYAFTVIGSNSVLNYHDDSFIWGEAVPVSPAMLEELGVPNAPVPAMFKLVNNADDCAESADIVDLTSKE